MGQTLFDCVVVGLGPAGAITAHTLARAGWSVLALDKRIHPRPKTCGGRARSQAALRPSPGKLSSHWKVQGIDMPFY